MSSIGKLAHIYMFLLKLKSNHRNGTLINSPEGEASLERDGALKHRCSEDQSPDAAREDDRCKHRSDKARVQLKFDAVDGASEVYGVGYLFDSIA